MNYICRNVFLLPLRIFVLLLVRPALPSSSDLGALPPFSIPAPNLSTFPPELSLSVLLLAFWSRPRPSSNNESSPAPLLDGTQEISAPPPGRKDMRSDCEAPLPLPLPFEADEEEMRFRSPKAASRSFPLFEARPVPAVEGLTGASFGVDAGRRACIREVEAVSRARGLKPTSSVIHNADDD